MYIHLDIWLVGLGVRSNLNSQFDDGWKIFIKIHCGNI